METVPMGIGWADPQGTIQFANAALARLVGAERPEALVGQSMFDLYDGETGRRVREGILPVVLRDGSWTGALSLRSGDRQPTSTMQRLFSLSEGDGTPIGVAVIVTEPLQQLEDHVEALGSGPAEPSTTMLEAVIQQSPVPMVLVSYPDMVIRCYNQACQEILGVEDEPSRIGQNLVDIERTWQTLTAEGEEIATAELPVVRAVTGLPIRQAEYRVRCKDGSERYCMFDAVPIRDSDGRLIAMFGVFPDITRHKLQESLIQAQYDLALRLGQANDLEATLRICLESLLRMEAIDGGGIYLVDDRTGALDLVVSAGLTQEFTKAGGHYGAGSHHAELVMAGAPVYFSGGELEGVLHEGLWDERLRTVAVLPVRHQGRVIAAINVASHTQEHLDPSVRTALETVASQVGSAISHAKALEQLRESEERYRNFVANASEAIFRVDFSQPVPIDLPDAELEMRAAKVGVVGEVNDALARMYGLDPEDVVGRPAMDFAPDCGARALQVARTPGHKLTEIETVDHAQDGRTLHFSENTVGIVENGCLVRIWGVKRDITEQKLAAAERERLEEQLRQSQKMEAIGRLAGGVAHDFNNILTGINGYAEVMLESLRPGDPLRADLEEILRAGERAASLTNQLLAFSRKQVIAPVVIEVNEVLERSENMLRRIIGEDIELAFRPGGGVGWIKADPSQIDQLLVNLAVNARDAMPDGGKLTIETANVHLDEAYSGAHRASRPGDFAMVAVSDDGRGMDKETLGRIFEPFFTTKRNDQGTGLGLATVYGIVQQNGGFINVYSEPGIGTSFKIYFPRVFEAPEALDGAPSSHPEGGTETILLAEDEAFVRSLARRVLEDRGYHVIEASDGGSAYLACLRHEGTIHLLLTDVVMPAMNGSELYEKLLELKPDMKVLYMSGYTENVIAHHGILDRGTALIQKPFSIQDLTQRVRSVLDGSMPD